MALSMHTMGLFATLLAVGAFLLYRALLPKPIPGIPYNPKSARRLFGDVPDALRHNAETAEMMSFLEKRCKELQTPICQVFMRSFSKPWVILADGRESLDIMTRRGREFDRSDFTKDLFSAQEPNAMALMRTNDRWRASRRLVGDTMSPAFLNGTGARAIHGQAVQLIELWRHKARLAQGRAFSAEQDVQMCTMDTIWTAAFGTTIGACNSQLDTIAATDKLHLPESTSDIVQMPEAELPQSWHAIKAILASSEIPMKSPLGAKHHWFALNFYPRLRRAMALRKKMVDESIDSAWKAFEGDDVERSANVKCAVDFVVQREVKAAKKEGRKPDKESKYLVAEMNSFIGAGFEATSATVIWGLKYLTHHQDVQKKLLQELRAAIHDPSDHDGQPAAEALAQANLPYLEAFMDEVLRHSLIQASNIRVATTDTYVLGHMIPKGTDVFMMMNGPSFKYPAMSVEESKRNHTTQADKDTAKWSQPDLDSFRPERFLDDEGRYDPSAAPMQSFGLGVRACFGRKLAYLDMRFMYALILWNFELLPLRDDMMDWKAIDIIAHQAQTCLVRLKEREKV